MGGPWPCGVGPRRRQEEVEVSLKEQHLSVSVTDDTGMVTET